MRSVLMKTAEQKLVFRELAVNTAIVHNQVQTITSNAFYSDHGTGGEQGITGSITGNRVGKEIYVKGIKVAINLEALQKRPHTTYWLYLIRNKADPAQALNSKASMFEGRSTTIPMDYLDTDKVHVLYCKKMTLRMPNAGTSASLDASGWAPTWANAGDPQMKFVVTNPQKIQKFYVPIHRKIIYNDDDTGTTTRTVPRAGNQYQWVIIGYDNYASPDSGTDSQIGSIHMTTVMYFIDV